MLQSEIPRSHFPHVQRILIAVCGLAKRMMSTSLLDDQRTTRSPVSVSYPLDQVDTKVYAAGSPKVTEWSEIQVDEVRKTISVGRVKLKV